MPNRTTETCASCGGPLGASELSYGTCGACGGRAKRPTVGQVLEGSAQVPQLREQIATLEGFKSEPTGHDLDRIEATYLEEGFADVLAVPTQGLSGRGWDVSVFAASSPYESGR